mgnify:CR=1 FL=1
MGNTSLQICFFYEVKFTIANDGFELFTSHQKINLFTFPTHFALSVSENKRTNPDMKAKIFEILNETKAIILRMILFFLLLALISIMLEGCQTSDQPEINQPTKTELKLTNHIII